MADIKNFLYAWCGKKKLTPNYDIRAAGNKNRQKFMCEVRVNSFPVSSLAPPTSAVVIQRMKFQMICPLSFTLSPFTLRPPDRCAWTASTTLGWATPPTRRMLRRTPPETLSTTWFELGRWTQRRSLRWGSATCCQDPPDGVKDLLFCSCFWTTSLITCFLPVFLLIGERHMRGSAWWRRRRRGQRYAGEPSRQWPAATPPGGQERTR